MGELPDLYRTWERWSAEVSETHTNYPSLMWFRSPVPSRSWLTALTAMLDAAALHDAISPGVGAPPGAALPADGDELPALPGAQRCTSTTTPTRCPRRRSASPYDEFVVGYQRLQAVGFPFERDARRGLAALRRAGGSTTSRSSTP